VLTAQSDTSNFPS